TSDALMPQADAAPSGPLSTCGVAGLQPGAPWPMFRRCPSHEARALVAGPEHGAIRWAVTLGDDPGSPTVGADGTIYAATHTPLFAIHPDGSIAWTALAPGYPSLQTPVPTIGSDGTIYVGAAELHAVAPTGADVWTYSLRRRPSDGAPGDDNFATAPAI